MTINTLHSHKNIKYYCMNSLHTHSSAQSFVRAKQRRQYSIVYACFRLGVRVRVCVCVHACMWVILLILCIRFVQLWASIHILASTGKCLTETDELVVVSYGIWIASQAQHTHLVVVYIVNSIENELVLSIQSVRSSEKRISLRRFYFRFDFFLLSLFVVCVGKKENSFCVPGIFSR